MYTHTCIHAYRHTYVCVQIQNAVTWKVRPLQSAHQNWALHACFYSAFVCRGIQKWSIIRLIFSQNRSFTITTCMWSGSQTLKPKPHIYKACCLLSPIRKARLDSRDSSFELTAWGIRSWSSFPATPRALIKEYTLSYNRTPNKI